MGHSLLEHAAIDLSFHSEKVEFIHGLSIGWRILLAHFIGRFLDHAWVIHRDKSVTEVLFVDILMGMGYSDKSSFVIDRSESTCLALR